MLACGQGSIRTHIRHVLVSHYFYMDHFLALGKIMTAKNRSLTWILLWGCWSDATLVSTVDATSCPSWSWYADCCGTEAGYCSPTTTPPPFTLSKIFPKISTNITTNSLLTSILIPLVENFSTRNHPNEPNLFSKSQPKWDSTIQ